MFRISVNNEIELEAEVPSVHLLKLNPGATVRISRDEFQLCEQKRSRVAFGPKGETSLSFTNDFAVFESEIARAFPTQIDGFRKLVELVRSFDDVVISSRDLELPHPRAAGRVFVLMPWARVDPEATLPGPDGPVRVGSSGARRALTTRRRQRHHVVAHR